MEDAEAGPGSLVGRWSVEHGFHSSMEDEVLVFGADGSGWYEYLRPGLREHIDFRWRLDGDALVRVRSDHPAVDETVPVVVGAGVRPLIDGPVRELSIDLSFTLGAPFAYVAAQ